jgi:integrase
MLLSFHPRAIANLPTPARGQVDYWDEDQPCFGIRVSAGGTRTWQVVYRVNGIRRRYLLGRFPELSLADAREEARKVLAQARLGLDPQTERLRKRKALSTDELVRGYVDWVSGRKKKWKNDKRVLENDFLRRFRGRLAEEVKKFELYEAMVELFRRSKSAPRMFQESVRQAYEWAINIGRLECANPAKGIPAMAPKGKRERFLSLDEIEAVARVLPERPFLAACAILLLLISGCREGEIISLQWNRIDKSYFSAPGHRTKMGRLHAVPITSLMGKIFDVLAKFSGTRTGFVFPAHTAGGAHISGKWLRRNFHGALVDAGIETQAEADEAFASEGDVDDPEGTIVHDLRRTAATHWQMLNVERPVIEALLDHGDFTPTGVYTQFDYWPERCDALRRWEAKLTRHIASKALFKYLEREAKHGKAARHS